MKANDRNRFELGYIACIEWCGLPDGYEGSGALPAELERRLRDEAAGWFDDNYDLLRVACENPGYDMERAGYDFWLTRNGHGAGFWDRGLGMVGTSLTQRAKEVGGVDIDVGDDGEVMASP